MSDTDSEQPASAGQVERELGRANSRGGECRGYTVQARVVGAPRVVAGRLMDGEWRSVSFDKAEDGRGVPTGGLWEHDLVPLGLMSYAAAQAMRWWLLAADRPFATMRTRLVEYRVDYRSSATPLRAIDEVAEARPNGQAERPDREQQEQR